MNKKEIIIGADFCRMLTLAENYFDTNNFIGRFEYHQCVVLKTEQGETIYSFACNTVKELVEQSCDMLINEKIRTVEKIVCVWEGGAIDVPPYRFMKALCELNDENKNTQILLNGGNGSYIIKSIRNIINV